MPLLEVTDLCVRFDTGGETVQAVRGTSFTVEPGRVLGIVGESGSGKSASSRAILGLLPANATVTGSIRYQGRELLGLPDRDLRAIRGREIGLIFQDPMASLNPVRSIGDQLSEAISIHGRVKKTDRLARVVRSLDDVGFPDAKRRLGSYPHELSGGLRQRVMIAMAMINGPSLIIADEPTSALDTTTQVQILELLAWLARERGTAAILITHDLGVAAKACDTVMVMYGGRVVERGRTQDLFSHPEHPYTWGLLRSMPALQVGGRLIPIPGVPPRLNVVAPGCIFAPRCQYRMEICETVDPIETADAETSSHSFACHLDEQARDHEANLIVSAIAVAAEASAAARPALVASSDAAEPESVGG